MPLDADIYQKKKRLSVNSELDLRRCFLSNETRSVAIIIESILQCAFEFRSCFTGGMWDMGLDQGDLLGKLSRINISQVILALYLQCVAFTTKSCICMHRYGHD